MKNSVSEMKVKKQGQMRYTMEELVPIVAELATHYTSFDSSSISYEKAQGLMGAVLYCLREYDGQSGQDDQSGKGRQSGQDGQSSKKLSCMEKYNIGLEFVREKAIKVRNDYNILVENFEDYGVTCLGDTIKKGILEFFKWYDPEYEPRNTILTLDYIVLADTGKLSGIDCIEFYLNSVMMEQRFLGQFDKQYIISILRNFSKDYGYMVENICSVVLPNIIGHFILQKPLDEWGFSENEITTIENRVDNYTVEQLEKLICRVIEASAKEERLREYLKSEGRNLSVRIRNAAKYHQLDQMMSL